MIFHLNENNLGKATASLPHIYINKIHSASKTSYPQFLCCDKDSFIVHICLNFHKDFVWGKMADYIMFLGRLYPVK